MSLEKKELIEKSYYESLIDGSREGQPSKALGLLLAEQQEDANQASNIRFAQGEYYYHCNDYETAIFKWEKVSNEFQQWARKNTADAYYELGELATAEDLYKSVSTDDRTLQAETALQLFSLYIERGKYEAASGTIKTLIAEQPDYPDAANIGRMFFEDQGDWDSAADLAVSESLRTQEPVWFDILKGYVAKGVLKQHPPRYFMSPLRTVYLTDTDRFGELAEALWGSYREGDRYSEWIKEFDSLLGGINGVPSGMWPGLAECYKEAYLKFLISGNYSIASLADIMPPLLVNWTRIAGESHSALASSALLAWGGKYPAGISAEMIEEAETLLANSRKTENDFAEALNLLREIAVWAEHHGLKLSPRLEWIAEQLCDFRTRHIVVAGMDGSVKDEVIRQVLGGQYPEEAEGALSPLAFRYREEASISKMTDQTVLEAEELIRVKEENIGEKEIYSFMIPSEFLQKAGVSMINLPPLSEEGLTYEQIEYIQLADSILFTMDGEDALKAEERVLLGQIRERAPGLPVHFILGDNPSVDSLQNGRSTEEANYRIKTLFPDSEVIGAGKGANRNRLQENLMKAIIISTPERSILGNRAEKLLILIRNTIDHLLEQRQDQEQKVKASVETHEEMASKLNGAINQLGDIEAEKLDSVRKSFQGILDEVEADMERGIPEVLKGTADYINDKKDFRTIHYDLNDEMNRRLQVYITETALPKLRTLFKEWIASSSREFEDVQEFLDEMSESFNTLYGEQWIKLDCDTGVIKDWERDASRMTSGYTLEKVNIMLKRTPSQLFLKGAGKLFGGMPQNNSMLYNRYKSFVEHEDYSETTKKVISRFLMQYEVFFNGLGRDVSLFFKKPNDVLKVQLGDTRTTIDESRELLARMKQNPESFYDPMSLFGIRLRQLEWLDIIGK